MPLPDCLLCHVEVESLDHPTVVGEPVAYACGSCYARLHEMVSYRTLETLRCEGCGAAFGSGCSCRSNARAIGRGERAKCESEQP